MFCKGLFSNFPQGISRSNGAAGGTVAAFCKPVQAACNAVSVNSNAVSGTCNLISVASKLIIGSYKGV
jgi:hypothetical protein